MAIIHRMQKIRSLLGEDECSWPQVDQLQAFAHLYYEAMNLLIHGRFRFLEEDAARLIDDLLRKRKKEPMKEEEELALGEMDEETAAKMTPEQFDDWLLRFEGKALSLEESRKLNSVAKAFHDANFLAERNIEEASSRKQRANLGFAKSDLQNFQHWFLTIVPRMLRELEKNGDELQISEEDLQEVVETFENCNIATCRFARGTKGIPELLWKNRAKALSLFAKHFEAFGQKTN